MATTTYRVDLGFETISFSADLAQASAPIRIVTEDGTQTTQYQTADARHDEWKAAVLVVREMGRDFWFDPSDPEPEDDSAYIMGKIKSVEEVD